MARSAKSHSMIATSWRVLHRYVRSALWAVPFIAIVLELIVAQVLHRIDQAFAWKLADFTVQGAQALLQTIISMTLSFVVFTFGSLLVAIQVASGQLTPRIIATTLLSDRFVRYAVGLFVFTLLFAVSALNRTGTNVHQLVTFVAGGLGLLSMATFLYLIDYAARLLRPISILERVAENGLNVIRQVYPHVTRVSDANDGSHHGRGKAERIIPHAGRSQVVLGVNVAALVRAAREANGIVEFVPVVGDFIAMDEPLFALYGTAVKIDDCELRAAVSFGAERTMEQDPTFAFRIVVDIALKALSPAINDPTTAVLALDQLHRLLRLVGKRNLRTDEIRGPSGDLRAIFRTPNWEDFVNLAFSEIRACGSSNLQIVRRLRAMIENLVQTLPAHRHSALHKQLELLEREIQKQFKYEEEQELARIGDSQGLGGHSQAH